MTTNKPEQHQLDLAAEADAAEGIRQGLEDMKAGRTSPAEAVFSEFRKEYGIPLAWTVGLFFAASCFAGPAFADESAVQFDLICHGNLDGTTWDGRPSSTPLTVRFHIDLKSNAFCNDDYCGTFTQQSGPKLIYQCKAVPSQVWCGRRPDSTAGPFISSEEFTIDRSSNSLRRTSAGTVGDLGPRPLKESYSADCDVAPFTGLPKPKGPPE
jgi:hypothetical protein